MGMPCTSGGGPCSACPAPRTWQRVRPRCAATASRASPPSSGISRPCPSRWGSGTDRRVDGRPARPRGPVRGRDALAIRGRPGASPCVARIVSGPDPRDHAPGASTGAHPGTKRRGSRARYASRARSCDPTPRLMRAAHDRMTPPGGAGSRDGPSRCYTFRLIVPAVVSTTIGSSRSGVFVGPPSTAAWFAGSNAAPWQGHSSTPYWAFQPTRQPWWVQVAS